MKVSFLSPNEHFLSYNWGTLRAYLEDFSPFYGQLEFCEPVTKFIFNNEDITELANCDLLLTSNYVWNHKTIQLVLSKVAQQKKKPIIICGGPHVPNAAEVFLTENPHIDFIVHGEGEQAILDIICALSNKDLSYIKAKNVSYRTTEGHIRIGQPKSSTINLNFHSPYLRGYFEDIIEKRRSSQIKTVALWETNRGCPFSCSFCDWGSATMNKVRQIPMERLKAEINFFSQNKIEEIYICDANFGLTVRDLEIAEILVNQKRTTGYPKRVRVSNAKNATELVYQISKLLSENQMLMGASLSMQSVDQNTLSNVNRKNIKPQTFIDLSSRFNKEGVHFYTELIFPLPGETLETFVDGIDTLLSMGNHKDIRIYEFSLLPNAEAAQQKEKYNFKTIERSLMAFHGHDRTEIVVETKDVSRTDWLEGFLFAEIILSMHNGGYTQYISRYLHREHGVRFKDFYKKLIQFGRSQKSVVLKGIIYSIIETLENYLTSSHISQWLKIHGNSKAMSFLEKFGKRDWFIWQYVWMYLSENQQALFSELRNFLLQEYPEINSLISEDLLMFQQQCLLTYDYDPLKGKKIKLNYDWQNYFVLNASLEKRTNTLFFCDQGFGVDYIYTVEPYNLLKFSYCAVGKVDPDTKIRQFMFNLNEAKKEFVSVESSFHVAEF